MNEPVQAALSERSSWQIICATDEVFEGCGRRYELPGLPALAVFNLGDRFQVSDDTCTHGDASLADGWLENEEVLCPFHSGKFCLKTGAAKTFPAEAPIKLYPTRVLNGRVEFQALNGPGTEDQP